MYLGDKPVELVEQPAAIGDSEVRMDNVANAEGDVRI
jgi:hypothetical protein